MKYTFDVKFTGYEQITVEADSLEEAEQKAIDRFEGHYTTAPAGDLRSKSQELQLLGGKEE